MKSDSFKSAVAKLKKIVPLFMSHRLAPHPLNFALWYSYVSDTDPELNKDMEQVMADYGTCPDHISESLYRKHIMKETSAFKGFDDGLLQLTKRMCGQVEDIRHQNDTVLQAINKAGPLPVASIDAMSKHHALILNQTEIAVENQEQFQAMLDEAREELFHLRQVMNDLSELDAIDSSTGLYNRIAFEQNVAMMIREEPAVRLSLLLVGIDGFHDYNDRCGRMLGDKLLREVATRVRDLKEDDCTVYRMSAGVIGVLIPGRNALQAKSIAETIRYAISRMVITHKRTKERVSVLKASVGVAQYARGESVECFIHNADNALYRANASGSSCVKIAS